MVVVRTCPGRPEQLGPAESIVRSLVYQDQVVRAHSMKNGWKVPPIVLEHPLGGFEALGESPHRPNALNRWGENLARSCRNPRAFSSVLPDETWIEGLSCGRRCAA
jgi:hypothetical protein